MNLDVCFKMHSKIRLLYHTPRKLNLCRQTVYTWYREHVPQEKLVCLCLLAVKELTCEEEAAETGSKKERTQAREKAKMSFLESHFWDKALECQIAPQIHSPLTFPPFLSQAWWAPLKAPVWASFEDGGCFCCCLFLFVCFFLFL